MATSVPTHETDDLHFTSLRIRRSQLERLRALAQSREVRMAVVIRDILDEYFDREPTNKEAA